jgi:hypothetical protein
MITKEKRKCLSVYPLHCGSLLEVEIGPSSSFIYIPICNISRNICMKKIEEYESGRGRGCGTYNEPGG